MRTAIVKMTSAAPYSQSKVFDSPERAKERADMREERCWRERCHVDAAGYVIIPPMAFKNCLDAAAKNYSEKIPGKGNTTYTKYFASGVLVMDPLPLSIKREDVERERLFVPSDGISGSGKRVWKNFPLIREWSGSVTFHVLDETITERIFEQTLEQAGKFVGIGRFRPERRGFYGRFNVDSIKWEGQ